MKLKLFGGIVVAACLALAASAQSPEVKDVTKAPAETPAAEVPPGAAAAGESPVVVVTEVEAPEVLATEVASVVNADGVIAIRWTEASSELWIVPEENIRAMCSNGRVYELGGIPGLAPISMNVEGGTTLKVGKKSVEIKCPLPAGYEDLGWVFEQRAAEHSAEGEFTEAHLQALMAVIAADHPVLFTPQRLKGYGTGGDHHMVVAALEQHLGQFPAYVLEVDNLLYVVPQTENLAACGETCVEPRLVVWHLHKHVAKKTKKKSPPRVSTPKPERPDPDEIEMICSPNC